MTVNLSALGGAGQQFFDNNGDPLTGGKLYSYEAGTTTPQVTYTTAAGNVPHSNPIILDAAGRVPGGEIWLSIGLNYKFVLKTSAEVTLATWDNITGINGTGIATNALYVQYDPAGVGAVATNVQAKLRETVSVKDFGAVGNGVADDYAAFAAALAAANFVFVPAGNYLIGTQIDITGNKTISGPGGNNYESLPAVINFTAPSGNLFSAISAQFGGIVIRNLAITGGNGAYAIRSSRVQSVFENILMEPFNGGGIQLFEAGTGSQASWGTAIRNVKWVGPTTQTPYYGFDITQNGGDITIDRCTAIFGSIGLNINQGQAINIIACSFNQQIAARSSLAADLQCGIRISGGGYKENISIKNCYIESYTNGIYVEKCESLTIQDNYIADVGSNSNNATIFLKDANVNNVSIRNNTIRDQGSNSATIDIGNGAKNVVVENNYMRLAGSASIGIRKGTTTNSYIQNNDITTNPFDGVPISDPNNLLINTDFANGGFATYKRKAFVSAPDIWYSLGPVARNEIFRLDICDANGPSTNRREDLIYVSDANVASVVNVFDVNPGFAFREVRVDAGILQFRVTSTASNQLNNVAATKLV